MNEENKGFQEVQPTPAEEAPKTSDNMSEFGCGTPDLLANNFAPKAPTSPTN